MSIKIIAAVARGNAIGNKNRLLYWLPSDLKRFKQLTTGHTIIMGHNTYLSLPKGALPNRRNIVLSHTVKAIEGCEVYGSLDEALASCDSTADVYIIGGASVYRQAMDVADMLCLTEIDDTPAEADAFFPDYSSWQEVWSESHTRDERHTHDFRFVDYVRPDASHNDGPDNPDTSDSTETSDNTDTSHRQPHCPQTLPAELEACVRRAVELFMEGYNCSQSVVMAFAPSYGVDEKTARLMSAGFGGGVGRLRMLCGAVSGAVMIAGLATDGDGGDDIRQAKAASYKGVQEIVGRFREENGSVICAELLGMKTPPLSSTSAMSYMPAERDAAYYAARPCAAKVESAARILARFIAEREAK